MDIYDYNGLYGAYADITDWILQADILIQNTQQKIKKIEDETNQKLEDYQNSYTVVSTDKIQKFAEYLDKAWDYGQILMDQIRSSKLYLESRVNNLSSAYSTARQLAASSLPPYSQEPSSNIEILEQMQKEIANAVQECVSKESSGFLGKGMKILGLQDNHYLLETCTMITRAELFFDGLYDVFQNLYDQNRQNAEDDYALWREELFRAADQMVQKEDERLTESLKDRLPQIQASLHQKFSSARFETGKEESGFPSWGILYYSLAHIEKAYPELHDLISHEYSANIKDRWLSAWVTGDITKRYNFIFLNQQTTKVPVPEINILLEKHIRAFPPGSFLFHLCSADGSLENFQAFSSFLTEFPKIGGEKIYTKKEEIASILKKYNLLLDDILQKKLIGYSGIEEFNEKNPNIKIPCRCICITGFPANFTTEMTEDLLRLLNQGKRAGISVLLNCEMKYADTLNSSLLQEVLRREGTFELQDGYLKNYLQPAVAFWLYSTSQKLTVTEEFAERYQAFEEKILSVKDLLDERDWFCQTSRDLLRIPIGINEYGKIHCLEMGDPVANGTSHYGLIIGATGSGKSNLLHTIITNGILSYPPEELELYLMDFKEGTEFKIYEDKCLPNIRCLALDTLQEFGESILTELWKILKERNELFTTASKNGIEIKNISDYRKAGYPMPRILVIADEFQVLFDREQNKKIADRCASLISEFISKARAYGIHFLFATQTLHRIYEGGSAINRSTLEEMHIRIGLQCQSKEMELLFGTEHLRECMNKQSTNKGSAVYLENDIVSKPVGVQIAFTDPQIQASLLSKAEKHYQDRSYPKPLIFRGKTVPVLNQDQNMASSSSCFLLGEPIHIAAPVQIILGRKRRENLLIIGENQETLDRLTLLWLYQAYIKQKEKAPSSLYLFDGGAMIEEHSLVGQFSFSGQYQNEFSLIDNMFRVVPAIHELYGIYETRKKRMIEGTSLSENNQKIHILISNYQWIEPIVRIMENRNLSEFETTEKQDDDDGALDNMLQKLREETFDARPHLSIGQKFRILLESGYLCGIQVVMSCNDFFFIKKILSSDLAPFTNRILLKTGSASVHTLVDTDVNLAKIPDNVALFSDSRTAAYLFKPYQIQQ